MRDFLWLIDIPKLISVFENPDSPTHFCGVSDNMSEVLRLPWTGVVFLLPTEEQLVQRIQHRLDTDSDRASSTFEQEKLDLVPESLRWFKKRMDDYLSSTSLLPDQIMIYDTPGSAEKVASDVLNFTSGLLGDPDSCVQSTTDG